MTNWLQKYALNLGWFLLLLGGVSLLDRGNWSILGIVMVMAGLFNMINTLRFAYLGKATWLIGLGSMYLVNIGGLVLLAAGHVFTTKKEISWELLGFLVFSLIFMFIGKAGAQNSQTAGSKKSSGGR